MTNGVSEDLHDLLGRRGRFLAALATGAKTKPQLVDEVGVSRSTVDRAVRELEAANLIERNGGTVVLTSRGGLILDVTEYFADIATTIDELQEELDRIPAADRPHYAQFRDATVVRGTEAAPHRPISLLEQELADASSVRAVALSVIPPLVEEVRRRVRRGDLAVEMVLSEAVLSQLVSAHQDALDATLGNPGVTLYRCDTDLPYGVSVLERPDGPAAFLVLQGNGGIPAIVRSDHREAVAWGNRIIDRERDRAEPVRSPG